MVRLQRWHLGGWALGFATKAASRTSCEVSHLGRAMGQGFVDPASSCMVVHLKLSQGASNGAPATHALVGGGHGHRSLQLACTS